MHLPTILYWLHRGENHKISENGRARETKVCGGVCEKLTITKSAFLGVNSEDHKHHWLPTRMPISPAFGASRVLFLPVNALGHTMQVRPDWSQLILVASSLLSVIGSLVGM